MLSSKIWGRRVNAERQLIRDGSSRSYYELLGVSGNATRREIRVAYQRLARQYSPDINPWDSHAKAVFQEISEAYRVLNDTATRSLYDRLGHSTFTRSGEPTRPLRHRPEKGEDLHYPVELSLEDSLQGLTATFEVNRLGHCLTCGGSGVPEGTSPAGCSDCSGSGEAWQLQGTVRVPSRCPSCGGSGQILPVSCERCKGRGLVLLRATVSVTIPPGVDTGTEIRIKGEGHAGRGGSPPGDLVVITRIRPHAVFTRKGDNLHCELPISITEAALGARVEVPTPHGVTSMILPPGTQSGQIFRLRGKGCSHLYDEGRGDLYVTVHVVIPKEIGPPTEELFRELDRLNPENPRSALLGQSGAPQRVSHE